MIINTLFDICKQTNTDLGKGLNFDMNKFYSKHNAKPIWNSNGCVHGINIKGHLFLYPFDFKAIYPQVMFD